MRVVLARGFAGFVGGLAGAWVMQQFRRRWDARPSATPDSGIFGFDQEADINSVDAVCSALSLAPLCERDALKAALVLHYAYGALAGSAYAICRPSFLDDWRSAGLVFGFLLWLAGDEAAMAVTGLSDPRSKSAASHGSAVFAHLLYGVTVDVSTRLLEN